MLLSFIPKSISSSNLTNVLYFRALKTFAVFWTLAGVTALIITILAVANNGRRSAEWVFTGFEPQSGWPDGWSFCIGLLQAAYALSATGMITSYELFGYSPCFTF